MQVHKSNLGAHVADMPASGILGARGCVGKTPTRLLRFTPGGPQVEPGSQSHAAARSRTQPHALATLVGLASAREC